MNPNEGLWGGGATTHQQVGGSCSSILLHPSSPPACHTAVMSVNGRVHHMSHRGAYELALPQTSKEENASVLNPRQGGKL
jgi:hypothetical protein